MPELAPIAEFDKSPPSPPETPPLTTTMEDLPPPPTATNIPMTEGAQSGTEKTSQRYVNQHRLTHTVTLAVSAKPNNVELMCLFNEWEFSRSHGVHGTQRSPLVLLPHKSLAVIFFFRIK